MERARISRRAILAGPALALRAQEGGAPSQSPGEELKAALDQQQSNYDQMRKAALSFFTEPALVFRP
jgi:hypothetical protein